MSFGGFNSETNVDQEMSEINVTPLVDVMLVLLVVFMIAMPIFTSSIKVQLPTSTSSQQLQVKKIATVTIDATGQYYYNEQPYNLDTLATALSTAYQADPQLVISIKADQATSYGKLASLLETLRGIGITKIGFVTKFSTSPSM